MRCLGCYCKAMCGNKFRLLSHKAECTRGAKVGRYAELSAYDAGTRYAVTRTKIEALLSNRGVPITDQEVLPYVTFSFFSMTFSSLFGGISQRESARL